MNAAHRTDAGTPLPSADAAPNATWECRVLILAPTGNDAKLTGNFLSHAGFFCEICRDLSHCTQEIERGCGMILLAEEALANGPDARLVRALSQQPAWSDIPLVIITSGGESAPSRQRRLALFGPGGNVALVERPFRPATLISTVEVALRARRRQYEARELLQTVTALSSRIEAQARLFNITLSNISDFAFTLDRTGRFIYANQPQLDVWRLTLEQAIGKTFFDLRYPAEAATRLQQQVQLVIDTKACVRDETCYQNDRGVEDYYEYIFNPVLASDGSVEMVAGSTRIITERKRSEAVTESQRRVLQRMAEDAPLGEVLESLVRTVELQYSTKVYGSVLLLGDGIHLRHAAAPTLAAEFRQAVDGIALGAGHSAAFAARPVYVADIATDALWADFRELALAHKLRACWSIPITSSHGKVLGIFALYHVEPCEASDADVQLLEMATRTASIAIERKLSDAALRESERQYSQLVQCLPAAVYTTDARGHVRLYNEAAVALWGQQPQMDKPLWCGFGPVYRPDGTALPLEECPMAITLREGRSVRGEELIIERPDGIRRNALPYSDPIYDVSGKLIGAINMLLDVTESRQAEAAAQRLAAIVQSSDDAIISKDLNSIIKTWNAGAERLFGYRAEEVVGQSVSLLMPADRWTEEPGILARIRNGKPVENYETIRRRKDGSMIEVSLTVSSIRDAKGRVIGASQIARDVTRQKQAERELERAHKEAVAASRAKDDFLAALSHELRTPLSPVLLLASDAAEDPRLTAEMRARFNTIRNNVELEARLIDDLLDITRIAHGKLSLNMGVVNIRMLLKEALTTVRSELDQKSIRLTVAIEGGECIVKGDPVRLQQAVWNVLKNAIKFTPIGGKITFLTQVRDESGELMITVSDDGIGMTSDDLARIFEAFTQGEHADGRGSHRFGGLGLGLAITRKLIELHGGTIRASSAGRDRGSTFVITLPLTSRVAVEPSPAEKRTSPKSEARTPASARGKILLLEDHEPTRIALASLLKRRGYLVETAASLAEARALAMKDEFHLLISDIGLPDGNGLDLMKELSVRSKALQGIALTGYGMEQDIACSRDAGFAAHLTKPVSMRSLDEALTALHDRAPSARETSAVVLTERDETP